LHRASHDDMGKSFRLWARSVPYGNLGLEMKSPFLPLELKNFGNIAWATVILLLVF
jgi:hypothetical protein